MSLKQQTFTGALWISGANFARKGITFVTTIVLARILEPSVFGLYALAFVVIDGFGLFKSVGLDAALIQRKDKVETAANTAFIIIVSSGVLIYLLLTLTTPLIAHYMKNDTIAPVIQALGLVFVLNAIQRVPLVLLEKGMKFNKIAPWSLLPEIVFSFFAILFAVIGWDIWSLVIAFLIKTVVGTWNVYYLSKWKPKFEFDKALAIDMLHFGKFVFFSSLIWFIVRSFDKMVIPKMLDMATLGLYAIAFNFATLVSSYLGTRVNRVIYPAYSKLQTDIGDLKRAYLKVLKLMALLSFPISVGLFFLGGEFLEIAYGEKWVGAIPILKILAWLGLINTVNAAGSGIFNALKRPKVDFAVDIIRAVIIFSLMIPAGRMYGVSGIAYVVILKSVVSLVIRTILLNKTLCIKWKELWGSYQTAIISTLFMAIFIVGFKMMAANFSFNIILTLILGAMIAAGVYLPILYSREKEFVHEIKGLMSK